MPSEFVPNPDFMPMLERAVIREMDDIAAEIERDVKARLSPAGISSEVSLSHRRARRELGSQVSVFVSYGRGVGPIFEAGTKPRYTKGKGKKRKYPAGVHRGQITTANHAMSTARDNALRRGLTLRYL